MASSSSTSEQWEIERQTLLQQIKSLEQKVQQVPSQSSSTIAPRVEFYTPTIMNMSTNQVSSGDNDKLVKIDPKSVPGIQSEDIDNLVQKVFSKLYKPPEGNLKYLQGNFAPVRVETPPTEITITDGTIPGTLNGMMLRNGPDAQFEPEGHYAWMDGERHVFSLMFNI